MKKSILALVLGAALTACAGPDLADHARQTPVLDLRQYFDGRVVAHGMVRNRQGKVLRRFVVTMDCSWTPEGVGTLREEFRFDDGERQQRIWQIRRTADGRWTGTAADVLGQAEGEAAGSAFHWRYTLKLSVDGSVYEVQFDDWMYRIDEETVINTAEMRKFGVKVGEVVLAFRRP
ncbi:DUF3833 domain-containing protein [Piscinibacter terrae]|uniref:DUF3833 domain-containing protein n=1 Tax=Piscinibacter terrae TaxID=2496871 RepID=A0A3N7HI85_9BURK|nr:DUF3833 domain-containing protein [Albitalea terrae]RQP21754.1 DUF3833 domain-containing protein [Albitalea terrae]